MACAQARRHQPPRLAQACPELVEGIHLAIDERTLEVCAVEVTSSNVGDAPTLPEPLGQIPKDREIGSVTADGAYDTRKCHDAIAGRGADAVIPTRKNARPWKPDTVGARARNDILRATQ